MSESNNPALDALYATSAEVRRLRAAWLRVIQAENDCRATGLPCREPALCGCKLEQDALCAVEDAAADNG